MTLRYRMSLAALLSAILATLGPLGAPSFASKWAAASKSASKSKIFAQRLVEDTLAKHSDITSVEIAVQSPGGCSTIAASQPKDVGEKCDKDELDPMRTGAPSVERESDGFDVTMPLHDLSGQIIGAIGMDLKIARAQQRSSIVERAKKILQEIEAQIPSRAKLFEPVE